jgi:hypothetical protein
MPKLTKAVLYTIVRVTARDQTLSKATAHSKGWHILGWVADSNLMRFFGMFRRNMTVKQLREPFIAE